MTMLLVQEFLKTHSLNDLANEHGVYGKAGNYKFSLNYNQIEAKDSDLVAQECRGLILRTVDGRSLADLDEVVGETVVMARPFKRFFNYGQGVGLDVDFSDPNTKYFEKLDGTLIILYWDSVTNKWCTATRSVPEADLPIDGNPELTFHGLFCQALSRSYGIEFSEFTGKLDKQLTYCIELTTPYNQIVVKQEKSDCFLLGVINNVSGEDFFDIDVFAKDIGIKATPQYSFKTAEELISFVNSRNPIEHEGLVARGVHGGRVKIKSLSYVAAHRAKERVSSGPRRVAEIILEEKLDDYLPFLAEEQKATCFEMQDKLREYFHAENKNIRDLIHLTKSEYPELGKEARKFFAISCNEQGIWMSPAADMYEGRYPSIEEWILSKKTDKNGFTIPESIIDSVLKKI